MKTFESTYGNHLSLNGATEHFYDYLCEEMNCQLEDYKEKYEDDFYEAEAKFTNGKSYSIQVYWSDKDDEWTCEAF